MHQVPDAADVHQHLIGALLNQLAAEMSDHALRLLTSAAGVSTHCEYPQMLAQALFADVPERISFLSDYVEEVARAY